jgi:hypothetical protein
MAWAATRNFTGGPLNLGVVRTVIYRGFRRTGEPHAIHGELHRDLPWSSVISALPDHKRVDHGAPHDVAYRGLPWFSARPCGNPGLPHRSA